MTQNEQDKRGGGTAVSLAIALVAALPILYVLSIGPAHWLMFRGLLSVYVYEFVYWPFVSTENEAVRNLVERYLEFWVPSS